MMGTMVTMVAQLLLVQHVRQVEIAEHVRLLPTEVLRLEEVQVLLRGAKAQEAHHVKDKHHEII